MTPRAQAGNPSRLSQPHPPHTYVIAGTLASVSLSSVGMTKTPLSASRRLFGRRRRGRREPPRSHVQTPEIESQTQVVCGRFHDTATTEIYTLSLHDALPVCRRSA